jgi:subtilisin family serine protease
MDKSTYYYANGQAIPLLREPKVYAVKFKASERADSSRLSPSARRMLNEHSRYLSAIPTYGIQIYQTNPQAVPAGRIAPVETLMRSLQLLTQESAVEFATPAYRISPQSQSLMFVTNRLIVQFKVAVTAEQIQTLNTAQAVRIVEPLGYGENGYVLELLDSETPRSVVEVANLYYESGLTEFAHPDFIRSRQWRNRLTPMVEATEVEATETTFAKEIAAQRTALSNRAANYLAQQWHLATAKVTDAWSLTQGSPNITIAILDDGVDITHPEFDGKVSKQFSFASNTANGAPQGPADNHGTACAGVATAAGVAAFGAAPGCKLMAVRTPDFLGVADEARMFQWAADNGADVISCSWGPEDGTGAMDVLPDNVRLAIRYCVTQGRNGYGIPIFWAAGNGDESVSLDGYASNPDVMAIAASTSRDTKAWYSDYGPEICVCAPSSGDTNLGEKGIFTADRRGSSGYNTGSATQGDAAGNYTNRFGGTSSATPLTAGVAALMLSVNAKLTPADIRNCLQRTAVKIGSGYDADGHSADFGYGRVDALAAVQAAQAVGGGNGGGIQGPTIQTTASTNRSGPAPSFEINPRPNGFYAVEVATQAALFDNANHGSERNTNNFYASWQDTPFMSNPTYILPTPVWQRLQIDSRLYYRLWTSASSTSWANYAVTVADTKANQSPFIVVQ